MGDGQNKARGIGDERAGKQIGQRLDLRSAGGGVHGRRENDGGRVVRQKNGDDGAHRVDDREQPGGRAPGVPHGLHRKPVEQAFLARDFGQQHHADQKEIDIEAFSGGRRRATAAGRRPRAARRRQPPRYIRANSTGER